jgi:hypothetical protein
MSDQREQLLDTAADAIVFAHEPDALPLPPALPELPPREISALERTAALAAAALALGAVPAGSGPARSGGEPPPPSLQNRLAAAGLSFCAEQRQRFAAQPPGFTTTLPRRQPLALLTSLVVGAAAAGLGLWFGMLRPQQATMQQQAVSLSDLRAQVLASEATIQQQSASMRDLQTQVLASEATIQQQSASMRDLQAQVLASTATMQQQAVSLRDLRDQVLASEQNAVRIEWKPGPSPLHGSVAGDVVWSPERQDGWLTFRGLPKLDPDHAYQLWIVDRRREGAPVDGGLFTIEDPAEETLVPIHAKLPIGSPVAFVITVEDKTGAVVSKREHVVAIAGL